MRDRRTDRQQKIGFTILATSLGFVLVQLDVSIINVALAKIGSDFGTGTAGLQWVVDSYALTFASLLLSAGALGDQIGARRAFTIGFGLFVLASLSCGLASGPGLLIVARIGQGVGAALLVPCSLALLNQASGHDDKLRARAVSLWTAAGSVALAIGPVLGGLLVDSLGWRSIFLIDIPIGCAGIFLTQCLVEESSTRHRTFDPAGQILAIVSLLGLVGAVIGSESGGWLTPMVLVGFGTAVIAGVLFVLVESHAPAPMLPLDFFRDPAFSAATLVGLAVNFTLYGVIFVLGLYFQRIRGYSPVASGLAFVPLPIVLLFSNIIAACISHRVNLRSLMVIGLVLGGAGYWLLQPIDKTTYLQMLPGLLVIPLGVGLTVPAMTTSLLSTVPESRSGVAAGVLNSVRQAGGALGVAVFGALLNEKAVLGARICSRTSVALLTAAAVVAAVGIRPRKRRRSCDHREDKTRRPPTTSRYFDGETPTAGTRAKRSG